MRLARLCILLTATLAMSVWTRSDAQADETFYYWTSGLLPDREGNPQCSVWAEFEHGDGRIIISLRQEHLAFDLQYEKWKLEADRDIIIAVQIDNDTWNGPMTTKNHGLIAYLPYKSGETISLMSAFVRGHEMVIGPPGGILHARLKGSHDAVLSMVKCTHFVSPSDIFG